MAKVDELVVKIDADFSDLKKELKKAGSETEKFGDKVTQAGGQTKSFGVSMASLGTIASASALAVTALGAAAVMLTRSQMKASKETKLWADRLDVSADRFSQLTVVARKFGGNVDDVGDSIKDLNERIADAARGNKTYEDALNMVGLASKDLINLDVDEQFLKVADAIGKMNNAGDRNFVTAELMADAGFRLIPMFQKGEQAIRGMMKSADELNQSLDTDQIEAFAALDQEFIRLELSTDTLAKTMAESLAPILEESARLAGLVADEITKIFESEKELKDLNLADQLQAQNDKLHKLRGSLLTAEGAVHGFEDSWAKTFMLADDADKTLLEGNVERLKMQIRLTTAEIEKLNAAKNSAGLAQASDGQSNQGRTGMLGSAGGGGAPLAQSGALLGPEEDKAFKDLLLENLLDYQDNEWDYRNAQRDRELEANRGFWDSMFSVDKQAGKANADLWESGWKGKQAVASKFMGQMSVLMNTNSRKQFEIGKAAAIAQVGIDTPKAAMSAYSAMAGIPVVGPALGGLAAAAAIASGVTQMQNIKRQSFGGGSAGGGGGFQSASDAGADGQGGGGGQDNITNFDVNLQGQSFSGEQIRALLSGINSELEDGAKLGAINVR